MLLSHLPTCYIVFFHPSSSSAIHFLPPILNIPIRIRRKPSKQIIGSEAKSEFKGKLESLFDQERVFSRSILNSNGGRGECCDPRRERVEDMEFSNNGDFELEEDEEEKWKFQAEILRAECNFLRMERDIALKKLELNRFQTKRTLRSAVETLVSGKEKIHEGKRVSFVLEEEIEELEYKLKDLQRNSTEVNDFEFRKCSNFDKEEKCVVILSLNMNNKDCCMKRNVLMSFVN